MRIPNATYRLQFTPSFGFRSAMEMVNYLSLLGISDIYASPIFKARRGSPHGYDVVDPTRINPELGTEEDFELLLEAVKLSSMGWLQDIVPNHMAYSRENMLLMDILENGENSRYAHYFDIVWDHPYESLKGRVLAPFLGKSYGESLEEGEIQLAHDETGLSIQYYDLAFPLSIESYGDVLSIGLNRLKKSMGEDHPDFIKLLGILYVLKTLPSVEEIEDRHAQIRFIKRIFWELFSQSGTIREFLKENIASFNGVRGNAESFRKLDVLLSRQSFRLSFWRAATEEINYRRFFNVNELICVRVEQEEVFNHSHELIIHWIRQGKITGIRIDHIDGLYDPTRYLMKLREAAADCYVVVEKILGPGEDLPPCWMIQGTTGYEFLNAVNEVFCYSGHKSKLTGIYSRFSRFRTSCEDLVAEKKRLIAGKHMAGDVDNLAHLIKKTAARYRHGSDMTLHGLRRAIVEVLVHFPVYRTYMDRETCRPEDPVYTKEAVRKAMWTLPELANELQFIENSLLLKFWDDLTEEERKDWIHFVMRFQQLTGPLMAKGFEDTLLYLYNRLISLNEVGGHPDRFGISGEDFHAFNGKRFAKWPCTLNATCTHDTKRGEDIRARLNVLSEIPGEWQEHVRAWNRMNGIYKGTFHHKRMPDNNDEYFFYQTLLGAFPFYEVEIPEFTERMKSYVIKAIREAKAHTAWIKPDADYENAYLYFVTEVLRHSKQNTFLEAFLPFQRKVAWYGIFNSLSQTLLKIAAPGIPDFYQGADLWDFRLVDPDNRRPVDFQRRKASLDTIIQRAETDPLTLIVELFKTKEDGRIKLFLIYRALQVRKNHSLLFRKGAYIPLETGGTYGSHLIAFCRRHGNEWLLVAVPRFLTSLVQEGQMPLGPSIWKDTYVHLPKEAPSRWKDALTGEAFLLSQKPIAGELFQFFPAVLLVQHSTDL